MVENQFSLGNLVAHKHYPEQAIGQISKFYDSGRVGVSGDNGTRSFLPKNLILLAASEDSSITSELSPALNLTKLPSHVTQEMLDDDDDSSSPSPASPIPPTPLLPPAQVEDVTEHPENCSQCGSHDIRRFHYHDPNEHYFYCRDCGHEGWRSEKLPPAQVEKLEVMEVPPLEVEELEDAIATPAEGIDTQSEAITAQADLELPPIPRDFSELGKLPEWWEKPILPDFRECSCGDRYDDDDDDLDWVQETYGVNAIYRGWKLRIYEGGDQIYATPPSGDRLYHCECELDLDGPDGQIALAQEFIDSWYFAQPSPGQLSLNIPEAVARDPPPRFQ